MAERKTTNIAKPKAKRADGDGKRADLVRAIIGSLNWRFFHDANYTGYAQFEVDGRLAVKPIRSHLVGVRLRVHCTNECEIIPTQDLLALVVAQLEALALQGDMVTPALRVAECNREIFYDLGGKFVRVAQNSVEFIDTPPSAVQFIMGTGMAKQVAPTLAGSRASRIEALRKFRTLLKITDRQSWILVQLWLVSVLRSIDVPMLAVRAEEDSGKSTRSRALKMLVDPGEDWKELTTPVSDQEMNIVSAAHCCRVLLLDNASQLSRAKSDLLCSIVTGAGVKVRELYTTADLRIIRVRAAVILTSVNDVVTQEDLASRCIFLTWNSLSDTERLGELDFKTQFDSMRADVLGALLWAAAGGLARIDAIRPERLPRMADFAKWALACAPDLDIDDSESVLEVLKANQGRAQAARIAENPLLDIIADMRENFPMTMTPTAWFRLICEKGGVHLQRSLPTSPGGFGRELTRQKRALERLGIGFERFKSGTNKMTFFNIVNAKPPRAIPPIKTTTTGD